MPQEPVIAVSADFLNFKKVQGRMPVVVTQPGLACKISLFYAKSDIIVEQAQDLTFGSSWVYARMPVMADCDGDALFINGSLDEETGLGSLLLNSPVREEDVPELYSDMPAPPFASRPVREEDVPELYGRPRLPIHAADGTGLLTTVLVDARGMPLGVAYSSMQSAIENFRPKMLKGKGGEVSGPYCIVTLHSRSRGIWPKGLRNPNDDKASPLPDALELSSGDYLLFSRMKASRDGSKLLIEADVPEGHGFCHEAYRHITDEKGAKTGMEVYFDEKAAQATPEAATPYRSCFHRVVLPKAFDWLR